MSYFLTALCASVVITGLTKIAADLNLNQIQLSWVQNAYGLTFGSFILLSGRLSDAFGRKRILNLALIIFGVSSIFTGVTSSAAIMIIARALQGIGAAILAPTSMALLMDYFEGPELVKALAWYSSISGLGSSIGLVLGGVLASYVSWRVGFYINVPVAAMMLWLSFKVLKTTPVTHQRFDIMGTVFSILGSAALVYAVNGAKNIWLFLIIALVVFALLLRTESKSQFPIMPLQIFHSKTRVYAYIVRALLVGSMMGFWFYISEFLQEYYHYTPLMAGIGFLPMTVTLFLTAVAVPRIVEKWGNRYTLSVAALVMLVGFIWIVLWRNGGYWFSVAIPMLFFGVGQGLGLTPDTNLGIAHVSVENTGVASGLVNTAHQLGSVLGVAVMISIASATVHAGDMFNEFHMAMIVGLVLTVVYTVITFLVPKDES
nr:MFS transporter [Levilactobacillus brevis]